LAPGSAELAAEVLLHHHVGGGLAPWLGDVDVALLEDALAVLAHDTGGAQLPLHPVVPVVIRPREVALDPDSRRRFAPTPQSGGLPGHHLPGGRPLRLAAIPTG